MVNEPPSANPPDTSSADTHFRRGNALFAQGRPAEALASYERTLALDPAHVAALANRGEALLALDRGDEAVASYHRALALRRDRADLHYNCGTVLAALRRYDAALVSFDQALALDPRSAAALYNRGNALAELKRPADALASYDRALAVQPDDAATLFNRGNALVALQRPADAVASYDRALAVQPDDIQILYNRANALAEIWRLDRALEDYDRVLAQAPGRADALNNRGNVLVRLKRPAEALAAFDRALTLRPDYLDALFNRGLALHEVGRFAEAARAFAELVARAPEFDYAVGKLLRCRLRCCDWMDLTQNVTSITTAVARGARVADPFDFIAISDSEAAQLQCARIYASNVCPPPPRTAVSNGHARHERIRIAYLSADFHVHATAHLAARLFEQHDRSRFEVHAMSFGPDASDPMRARLQRAFDQFVDVRSMADREVSEMLRNREIDIAVDLKGFTTDCRTGIFARHAAPIQVSFLGYPGTMGTDYIDYIIADERVIPAGHDAFYTEKVVRLPDTYQVNDPTRPIAERVPTRTEVGLPPAGFVFACFNNSWKITPRFFAIWMRLLDGVAGSVLWLLADNADAVTNLRRAAQQRGIAPERLVFASRIGLADHLARHRQADLFLDTLPYNAHTTASDALWAGVPVLTCTGDTFAGRVAGSLLHAAGLPELVTDNEHDYEALAQRLAIESEFLSSLRARLERERASCALFDIDRFRRHLEAAYEVMVDRHQRGEPPAPFSVAPLA